MDQYHRVKAGELSVFMAEDGSSMDVIILRNGWIRRSRSGGLSRGGRRRDVVQLYLPGFWKDTA